jgi:hypothetical protein
MRYIDGNSNFIWYFEFRLVLQQLGTRRALPAVLKCYRVRINDLVFGLYYRLGHWFLLFFVLLVNLVEV